MNDFFGIIIFLVLLVGAIACFVYGGRSFKDPKIILTIAGVAFIIFALYVAYLLIGAPSS
jgi:hypothetical protein